MRGEAIWAADMSHQMALCSQAQDRTGQDECPSRRCGGVHVVCRYTSKFPDLSGGLQLPVHSLSIPQLHLKAGTMLKLSHVPLHVGWSPSASSTALGGSREATCPVH